MNEYIYYWYHHMMPDEQRKEIHETIENKNYFKFIDLYKKYAIESIKYGRYYEEFQAWCPMTYLPNYITVFDEQGEIIDELCILDKENFEKITYDECECG